MTNMRIIHCDDGKHEVIRDAADIKILPLENMLADDDTFDPDEPFYESSIFGLPYITVEFTSVVYYDDGIPNSVNDSVDICYGDTIIFADERIEFTAEFENIAMPKWGDFCRYVRKLAAKLNSDYHTLTAINLLEKDNIVW